MITPIVKEPQEILHRKAKPVEKITADIARLVETMIETMHVTQGVGLAANQINSDWDILVANPHGKKGQELVLLNARILEIQGKALSPEGCLSLPGISGEVPRAQRVTVRGLNAQGQPVEIKTEGLLARILQHEVDHLSGHLFVDRMSLWKRTRLLQQYQKLVANLRPVDL